MLTATTNAEAAIHKYDENLSAFYADKKKEP